MRKNGKRDGAKMLFAGVLAGAAVVNAVSYTVARAAWYMKDEVGATLVRVRDDDSSSVMNYLIAGNLNQPEKAFGFLEDRLDGGITYVRYAESKGCSMHLIAQQVLDDIQKRNCKARIIAISMGDYVSRCAESTFYNLDTVAINPVPHPSVLKPVARNGLRVVTPIIEALTIPLGWLSSIPCIHGFSLVTLADQWRDLAYLNDAPWTVANTVGVVCSDQDEFLLNDEIADYFLNVPVVTIESRHGDTEGNAAAYAEAWDKLMEMRQK